MSYYVLILMKESPNAMDETEKDRRTTLRKESREMIDETSKED